MQCDEDAAHLCRICSEMPTIIKENAPFGPEKSSAGKEKVPLNPPKEN